MAVVVLTTSLGVFLLSKQISAYEMGEAYAKNMGLNVPVFRMMLVLLSSILSASVTAFAGPVLFCRDCGTTSGEKAFPDGAPDSDDSDLFFGRWSILSVL